MAQRWEPKERKSFPFILDEKGLNLDERTFSGYFAITGHFDGRDFIDKGAFKKTLHEQGGRIKLYHIHDWKEPIGKPLEIKEVSRSRLPQKVLDIAPDATGGLWAKCYISDTRRGNDDLVLLKDGVMNEGSIGFDTMKEEWEEHEEFGESRHIKELRLYDISLVPLAMNEAAIMPDYKGRKVEETEDYIHVPVPGEEGKHDGHKIRTISIDEDQGIQARYCVDCKKNIAYIFAKEKGWTVKKAVAWVKEHSKEANMEPETKGIVAFQDLPLAPEDRPWDRAAAERRVRGFAGGSASLEDMNWGKYRRAFVWFDSEEPENVGSYKLQIGDIIDSRLMAVPRGVFACAVVLQGGRGGVDVKGDTEKCKAHIERYYKKMDRESPFKGRLPKRLRDFELHKRYLKN